MLLWWAKKRLLRLSERACDDWVLACGQPGTDYVDSLLDLVPQPQMAFVPAVLRSKKGLADRVRRILRDKCGNPRAGLLWVLVVCAATACIGMGVAFAQTRPAKF
jgi:beta-lactamase regulating signal transducer with metallopeptidase domain